MYSLTLGVLVILDNNRPEAILIGCVKEPLQSVHVVEVLRYDELSRISLHFDWSYFI